VRVLAEVLPVLLARARVPQAVLQNMAVAEAVVQAEATVLPATAVALYMAQEAVAQVEAQTAVTLLELRVPAV
jgi:hypothetical protein